MNIKPLAPVWLFDLDNTLHNASHAIFPAMVEKMNAYMARVLGDGETPASAEEISATRALYWQRYGATLLGLVRHHGVDAAHFLRETHDLPEIESMIRYERGLGQLLRRLPGRKILVEDTLENLRSAHALGMRTVWVTQYLLKPGKKPAWLDVKVKSVKKLQKFK